MAGSEDRSLFMFEAARPEWGGSGTGVGRGEGWEGVGKGQTGVGTA